MVFWIHGLDYLIVRGKILLIMEGYEMIKADTRFRKKDSDVNRLRKLLLLANHFGFVLIPIGFLLSLMSYGHVIAKESSASDKATMVQVQEAYGKLPLYFIQNNGQMDEKVKFYEKGSGHTIFFTKEGVYILLTSGEKSERRDRSSGLSNILTSPLLGKGQGVDDTGGITSEFVKFTFLDANPDPEIITEGLQEGRVNYFTGKDPGNWKTNIPTYQAVLYKEVYPGIDIKFYGNNRQMEYDIIVKPGADPDVVKFSCEGIKDLRITNEGNLEIILMEGSIIQKTPLIYQEIAGKRIEVKGKFKILNKEFPYSIEKGKENQVGDNPRFYYSFEVASYDKSYPLVIDPTLIYSTFLGGGMGKDIAVDGSGNAYIIGGTGYNDFPTTDGAYDTSFNGNGDIFVSKLNAAGSALIYSTFLGGSSGEASFGIDVDSSGNAYLAGLTWSTDFPFTTGAYDTTYNGNTDVFVAKLDAAGSALIYSTFLGGSGSEYNPNFISGGISVDSSGSAYVTGETYSTNFPTTAGAYDTTHNGGNDVFVTTLNPPASVFLIVLISS